MKLYYVSDVHLELRKPKWSNKPIIVPSVNDIGGKNILALCGDIGNPYSKIYEDFITLHSKLFHHIFIVSGNHEYYSPKKHYTINEIDCKIQEIVSKFENVTFLQKKSFEIEGVIFLGCTLWSNTDEKAETIMSDFHKIYTLNDFGERCLIKYMNILQLHGEMLEWIEETIAQHKIEGKKEIVVLTHHAPSFRMTENDEMVKNYYATDCEYLFEVPVFAWISGHTHKSLELQIKNTICASNCLGYPNEKGTLFNKDKYIKIKQNTQYS